MSTELQVTVFRFAKEEYALPITKVKSIIKLLPITKMPNAPLFVEGIINLRGEIIPIVDLRPRFNLSIQPATDESRIIIVDINQQMVGIIVDCVDEVIRVPMDDIDLPPAAARLDTTYITGICKYNLRLITLLDIDKVLTQDEVKDLKKVDG
ncbi:chemotaxis protein CheW [Anaerosinus gibii]|uniref:Chemotaxis protein CheW n=1 Tax=Selenobaculum gibii TaxID=3054208 RepID=A0A9Y2AJC7_9FIRM|nr:chemotaxis protein CheW [Selenobaculum gbiensis]WIW70942.1 chemotaxis protein CheW [Selenobaculum gbiensis]